MILFNTKVNSVVAECPSFQEIIFRILVFNLMSQRYAVINMMEMNQGWNHFWNFECILHVNA